jgi:hypothetical protein
MPAAATKKRKSDTTSTVASKKKAKLSIATQADTVDKILSDATNYEIPDDDAEIRDTIIKLAQYARSLEEEISASKPKEMSSEQLEAAAAKIASAACSGIKKQMTVSRVSYHSFAIPKAWLVETVMQDGWLQVDLRRRLSRSQGVRHIDGSRRPPNFQGEEILDG